VLKVYQNKEVPTFRSGRNPQVVMPTMTFLNPLSVRVASNGTLGEPVLVHNVDDTTAEILDGLKGSSSERLSAAAKNELRKINPIADSLYLFPFNQNALTQDDGLLSGVDNGWVMNPRMVSRYTLLARPWQSKYAPVYMKRIFGLAEAKRLLNTMDWTLLNGGINYLIVAKKGSDQQPAHQAEIDNMTGVIRRAARTGIIVGDHRIDIELIMPNMDNLLSPDKRGLLGRKISKALLRLPDFDFGRIEGGGTPEAEIVSTNMMSDRRLIKRQIERDVYQEIALRNPKEFVRGVPSMWFPPVMIAGNHFFTDFVLKLRDRGDIPRSWAIDAAGFKADAALAERRREIDNGFDDVMQAQQVPNSGDVSGSNGRPRTEDQSDDGQP